MVRALLVCFLLHLICSALTSCGRSAENSLRTEVEKDLKQRLDDPGSYEFVSLTKLDSVKVVENIETERRSIEHNIEFSKSQIEYENTMRRLGGKYDNRAVVSEKTAIATSRVKLNRLATIEKQLGKETETVASYAYRLIFRANNKFGAKVLSQYTIQTGPKPDLKLLNIAATDGQMLVMPGAFPGYDTLNNQK